MIARSVNAAADVIHRAQVNGTATAAGLAIALESAQMLVSPEMAHRMAELEQIEARLRALLPTEPRPKYGLPNDLAAAAAEYGVWELVAEVLGVALPNGRPADGAPIAYTLTEKADDVRPQVRKLRALLAGQRGQAGGASC